MFSKVKKFLQRNLFLIFAFAFVGVVLVAPQFLAQEKQIESESKQLEVTNNKNSEALVSDGTEIPDQQTPQSAEENTQQSQSQSTQQVKGSTVKPQQSQTKVQPSTPTQQSQTSTPVTKTITLNINTGATNFSYKVSWQSEMTVFDVLTKASSENGFSLRYTNYGSWGVFITELHGISGDWVYEVNGHAPMGEGASASKFKIQENDIITWKKV